MKVGLRRGVALIAVVLASAACGRKPRAARHAPADATAQPAPTPDNTPIPLLQTPAGLLLKPEEAVTPTPVPQTTAVFAPSPAPK